MINIWLILYDIVSLRQEEYVHLPSWAQSAGSRDIYGSDFCVHSNCIRQTNAMMSSKIFFFQYC